jgi:hypothetical protein
VKLILFLREGAWRWALLPTSQVKTCSLHHQGKASQTEKRHVTYRDKDGAKACASERGLVALERTVLLNE